MSDMANNPPQWNPLGWAQLTQQKEQNQFQNQQTGWNDAISRATDVFNTFMSPQLQGEQARQTAAFTQGLPMSPYQTAEVGLESQRVKLDQAFREEQMTHYNTIEKINAQKDLTDSQRNQAIEAENTRHNQEQEKIDWYRAQHPYGSEGSPKDLAAQSSAMDGLMTQWAKTHGAFDAVNGVDWDKARQNIDSIVKLIPDYLAQAGLDRANARAAERYLRRLLASEGGASSQPAAPASFDWGAAGTAHPSQAGAISGQFGSDQSILGQIVNHFTKNKYPLPKTEPQTAGPSIDFYRRTGQ